MPTRVVIDNFGLKHNKISKFCTLCTGITAVFPLVTEIWWRKLKALAGTVYHSRVPEVIPSFNGVRVARLFSFLSYYVS